MLSARALLASPRFELVAVADTSAAAIERLSQEASLAGAELFPDYQSMFSATAADVVCVSTYAPTHEEIAMAAMDLPAKGLLVEKPLAGTVAAGQRIVGAAKARQLPIVVPHGLMARDAPREVLSELRSGAIGALRVVEMECTGWDLINAGIHWIQYFVALSGTDLPERVLCACDTSTRTFRDGLQVETEAITLVTCAGGVRLVLHTGDQVPLAQEGAACLMRIVGDRGYIEYGAWLDHYRVVAPGRPDRSVEVPPSEVSGHRRHLEHLADLIETRTVDYEVADTSLLALEIIEAAYLSNRVRASVTLPLSSFAAAGPPDWDPGSPYSGRGGGRDGRQLP